MQKITKINVMFIKSLDIKLISNIFLHLKQPSLQDVICNLETTNKFNRDRMSIII